MSERPLYVHFEGADLAGKSYASKNFAKTVGGEWTVQRNRLNRTNLIQPLADEIRIKEIYDGEVIGILYYAALLADIRTFKWPEGHTIQDSTITLRSLAYHTVSKTPRLPAMFKDLLEEHPKFDASFVLTASLEARKDRLAKRLRETPEIVSSDDTMIIQDPKKFLDIEAVIIEHSQKYFGSQLIDTTNLTEPEVLNVILKNTTHLVARI